MVGDLSGDESLLVYLQSDDEIDFTPASRRNRWQGASRYVEHKNSKEYF